MKIANMKAMVEGLEIIKKALLDEIDNHVSEEPVKEVETKDDKKVVDIKDKVAKKDVVEEVEQEEETEEVSEVEGSLNAEVLNAMSLKELKELAKELGVAVRGSKSAIVGRILEAQSEVVETEVEEEQPVQESEVEEEEMEVEDDLETQLSNYTVEELADILDSVGISAKGKKQALIAKVLKAVEEGKISFEDDDAEDEEVAEETTEEVEADGIDLDAILEDLGMKELKAIAKALGLKVKISDKKPKLIEMIGEADLQTVVNVLVEMEIIEATDDVEEDAEGEEFEVLGSDARKEVVENNYAEFMESVENGETTIEEIDEFLTDFYASNKSELKKLKSMSDEDKATMFCWIQANLVDDEGEEVEFNEPYMVGETPFCCGLPMKKLNDTTYVCEIDGEEIEVE